jgi:hypothetical protein
MFKFKDFSVFLWLIILYWLQKGKPGGQNILKEFNTDELNRAYASRLDAMGETDTIIAIAEK